MTKKSQFNRLPETMEAVDVGPYLRGIREHYKLSEQDVSARLHIRVKYIQAIEAGAVDQLPGKVYARGHITTYAEFLGVDPDQAAEKLLGSDAAPKKQEFFVPEPMRAGQRPRVGLWLGLLMIGAVIYFLMRPSAEAPPPDVAPVPDALVDNARTLIMPTGNMLRCAAGENLGACIIRASGLAGGQPLAAPDIFTAPTPWDGRAAPVPAAPAPTPNDAADTPRVIRPGAQEKPAISESPEPPLPVDLPWLRKPAAEESR